MEALPAGGIGDQERSPVGGSLAGSPEEGPGDSNHLRPFLDFGQWLGLLRVGVVVVRFVVLARESGSECVDGTGRSVAEK
jgi:hypothetical protein